MNTHRMLLALLAVALTAMLCTTVVCTESEIPREEKEGGSRRRALILAHKHIAKREIVTGDSIDIEVTLYNIGEVAATHIVIEDSQWDAALLPNMDRGALLTKELAALQPGEVQRMTYSLTAPATEGSYSGSPAKIQYRSEAADGARDEVFTTYSTQIFEDAELPYDYLNSDGTLQARSVLEATGSLQHAGKVRVISKKAFNEKHAHHIKEALIFMVLLLIPVGLPYYFYTIRSKELQLMLLRASA